MNDSEKQTIVFIPRNFIEKGTFMGGMFKIRNAIEGGILAVLIAVPVIQLPLSLTVRIIILCMTALPAAMISLIGIGGESISAFLMNALRFLKNRRVIYRIDVNPDPKNKHRIKKPRNKEPKAKKHKHPKKKSTASMTASGQSDKYEDCVSDEISSHDVAISKKKERRQFDTSTKRGIRKQAREDIRILKYPDMDEAAQTAAILCDNVYRRIRYGDTLPSGNIKNDIPAKGLIQRLTPLNIQKGVFAPTDVIQGTFQVLKSGVSYKRSHTAILQSDFVSKYILSESRTLTPQEELTVPILEDWYIIPKEIQRICEHAKLTTSTNQPMRNFLLRGPAGTGKTEGAKAIAAGMHLPYRCITCSANTEIFDLLGQILPDVDGKMASIQTELPSFQDIMLDPATAYEKLTGTYDETVTEDIVYQTLVDHIFEEMHQKYTETSKSQRFRYVDTPLVEAIRNGYLVEIQEPTVIANPGVLVGLNSLLDRCNSVFLPNGEVIKRHSDTVIVVTTNNDYAGCRPMNQSVISRMNLVIDMDEPDEDTMIERVLAITGCSDKKSVRTMAQIVRSIAQYCQDNLITDGCCGIRELIAWVQSFMICGDLMEAAHYTILSSVTADTESRLEIEGSCLETVIAA